MFVYKKHMLLNKDFKGASYRLANNWLHHLSLDEFMYRPINYLEIGVFYGGNAISVANTYAFHDKSKLYCIDPWEDYEDYPEYKERQPEIYDAFMHNIEATMEREKFEVLRGYSNKIVPTLPDDFFDIIYIDGNHEPEYVLEDAVHCFRKLRKNGFMIFDDYGWGGPELTQKGVDAFLKAYSKRIEYIGEKESQVFVKKL
jgi:predicted O-methyltransferase YrrM